jgi:hypothetical protein
MRINSSGNVGIGTTAPTSLGAGVTSLDVAGTAGAGLTTRGTTVTGEVIALDAAGGLYISTKTSHPMILRTADVERMRITSAGALLVGTTTAPTVNTGTVAVIGSSIIHSGTLNFGATFTQNVQIDIVYSNWGANNVIGLVDVMVGLREWGATSGTAFGKVFATNTLGAATFGTFNTTDVTTSECAITATSGGNYTLRITIDPSNNTDLGSFYLNIPTGGGVNVSSISVTLV